MGCLTLESDTITCRDKSRTGGYKPPMTLHLKLTALVLSLALAAPALAEAATPKKKPAATRHIKRWTTPPGYRTPEQIERDQYVAYRRNRNAAIRTNAPRAYYYYYGEPFYNGRLGGNRRDSWHVGPCWTQTPIGAVWNCGN
jgi:hypothetical protein